MLARQLRRAWLIRGIQAHIKAGRLDKARRGAQKLVSRAPTNWEGYALLADAHFDSGDVDQALNTLADARSRGLNEPQIWNRIGLVHRRQNHLSAAEDAYKNALERDPNFIPALVNLSGLALQHRDYKHARTLLERVLSIDSAHVPARINLALVLAQEGQTGAAEQKLTEALDADPANFHARDNLIKMLIERDQLEQAERLAREGIEIDAKHAASHCDLAQISILRNNPSDAMVFTAKAQQLAPQDPSTLLRIAVLLRDTRQYSEAEHIFQRLLALNPNEPLVHFNYSFLMLLMGRFDVGWNEYEYRKLTDESPGTATGAQQWRGVSLNGKLLIYAEQGIGDEIMFSSCLKDAFHLARACVVQCDPRLEEIFQRSFPNATVVGASREQRAERLTEYGPFDGEIPIGSLPMLFRRDRSSFPMQHGYLRANRDDTQRLRSELENLGPGKKIGVCWRGGLAKTRQAIRSIALQTLVDSLPKNATLISVQHGSVQNEIDALLQKLGRRVHSLVDPHNNLNQLASLLCALDVVVSVQSTTVHLCGALDVPCFTLLPHSPEWRYLAKGDRMPWYHSVRLFRQEIPGDWSAPLRTISEKLLK